LGLSQSAVSRALSSLENRTGLSLFERVSGRLHPTAAAVQLNTRLGALFEALEFIEGPSHREQEHLHLVAPPTYASRFLTTQITTFLKSRPGTFLRLEFGSSEDVASGVQTGRFDLGVLGTEPTAAGVKLIPFRRAGAVCAMLPDHPLAALEMISPEALHGHDLIAQGYRMARRARLEALFHDLSVRPNIVAEVSSSLAAAELVRAGMGVSVINPFPLAQQDMSGLVFRPFPAADDYLSYFAVPRDRPVPRIATHFMRHVRLHTPKDTHSRMM
jgi:DNA-binding transcriptional LysR family regulator